MVKAAKTIRSGIHIPGREDVDMRRIRSTLKGRTGSNILSGMVSNTGTKTIDDAIETVMQRLRKEQKRKAKLERLPVIALSEAAKEKEYRLSVKEKVINKLHIALVALNEQKSKNIQRTENRQIIKYAVDSGEVVRVGKRNDKFVAKKPIEERKGFIPDMTIVPKPRLGERVEGQLIKQEMKRTIQKEQERKKRRLEALPKEVQSEIERVFGAKPGEIPTEDEFEKMFSED